eukprot:Partr_v1_DN25976_c1_g1_i1_m68296 putative cell division cycle
MELERHIINCSLPRWIHKFRTHTFKTHVIHLPPAFIDFLNSDGIILPLDSNGNAYEPYKRALDIEYDSENDGENADEDSDGDDGIPTFDFNDLQREIELTIAELGGSVFPKLDWSSPRDASWMNVSGTPRCNNAHDIFLMLKSSDFIAHDLSIIESDRMNEVFGGYNLVLREWKHYLNPGMEFRCFVRDGDLRGISQRDYGTFYDFLAAIKDDIEDSITEFFDKVVADHFGERNYAMDVYLEQSARNDNYRVYIVDFNPLILETDMYLFQSVEDISKTDLDFRIIESPSQAAIYSSQAPRFSTSMLPQEAVLMSQGKTLAEFAQTFRDQMLKSQQPQDEE